MQVTILHFIFVQSWISKYFLFVRNNWQPWLMLAMGLFLVICAVISFGVLAHALPPVEARHYIPSVGESCDFEGVCGFCSMMKMKALKYAINAFSTPVSSPGRMIVQGLLQSGNTDHVSIEFHLFITSLEISVLGWIIFLIASFPMTNYTIFLADAKFRGRSTMLYKRIMQRSRSRYLWSLHMSQYI